MPSFDKQHHLNKTGKTFALQAGMVLLLIILIFFVGSISYFFITATPVTKLYLTKKELLRDKENMEKIKEALLAYSIIFPEKSNTLDSGPGFLPCPDSTNNGETLGSCSEQASTNLALVPWKTLGIERMVDKNGSPYWYVISDNFRNNPAKHPLHANTAGGFVIHTNGESVLSASQREYLANTDPTQDVIAAIIAPGAPLNDIQRTHSVRSNILSLKQTLKVYNHANIFLEQSQLVNSTLTNYIQNTANGNDFVIPITRNDLMHAVGKRILYTVKTAITDYKKNTGVFPAPLVFANPYIPPTNSGGISCLHKAKIGSNGNNLVVSSTACFTDENNNLKKDLLIINLTDNTIGTSEMGGVILPIKAPFYLNMHFSEGDDVLVIATSPQSYFMEQISNEKTISNKDAIDLAKQVDGKLKIRGKDSVFPLLNQNSVIANLILNDASHIKNIENNMINLEKSMLIQEQDLVSIALAQKETLDDKKPTYGLVPIHAPGAPFITPIQVSWDTFTTKDLYQSNHVINIQTTSTKKIWEVKNSVPAYKYTITLSHDEGFTPPTAGALLHSRGSGSRISNKTAPYHIANNKSVCVWWTPQKINCQIKDENILSGIGMMLNKHGNQWILEDRDKNFRAAGVRPGDIVYIRDKNKKAFKMLVYLREDTKLVLIDINASIENTHYIPSVINQYRVLMHSGEKRVKAAVGTKKDQIILDQNYTPWISVKKGDTFEIIPSHSSSQSTISYGIITDILSEENGIFKYKILTKATNIVAGNELNIFYSFVTKRQYNLLFPMKDVERSWNKDGGNGCLETTGNNKTYIDYSGKGSAKNFLGSCYSHNLKPIPINTTGSILIVRDFAKDVLVGTATLTPDQNANFSFVIENLQLGLEPAITCADSNFAPYCTNNKSSTKSIPAWITREGWQQFIYLFYNTYASIDELIYQSSEHYIGFSGSQIEGQNRKRLQKNKSTVSIEDFLELVKNGQDPQSRIPQIIPPNTKSQFIKNDGTVQQNAVPNDQWIRIEDTRQ